jgi:hypothetical protein
MVTSNPCNAAPFRKLHKQNYLTHRQTRRHHQIPRHRQNELWAIFTRPRSNSESINDTKPRHNYPKKYLLLQCLAWIKIGIIYHVRDIHRRLVDIAWWTCRSIINSAKWPLIVAQVASSNGGPHLQQRRPGRRRRAFARWSGNTPAGGVTATQALTPGSERGHCETAELEKS